MTTGLHSPRLRHLLLALLVTATAPRVAVGQTPHLGGFLSLDRRFEIGADSVLVADFYNRFRAELSSDLGESVRLFVSLDARFYDFAPSGSGSEEARGHVRSTELRIWEAYAELPRFLVDALDVTVGKQRIRWGTADELNPTDIVNAHDLTDLVDFTARVPTWAVRADYYLGETTLTALWLPTVRGPLLPPGGAALLRGDLADVVPSAGAPPVLEDRVEPSSRRPGDGVLGVRLSGYAAGIDYSLSFVDGSHGIPVPERIRLERTAGDGGLRGRVVHGLPRARFLGADLVTDVRGVRLWGEATLVLPSSVETVVRLDGREVGRFESLDDRPYVRSTVGLDYTFPGGWYANLQWAHGLFLEQGGDRLHDYLVGRVERGFLRDELRVTLGGSLEAAGGTGGIGPLGWGVSPELTYSPMDNLKWTTGLFLVGGPDASLFGTWDAADQLYTRVKVFF